MTDSSSTNADSTRAGDAAASADSSGARPASVSEAAAAANVTEAPMPSTGAATTSTGAATTSTDAPTPASAGSEQAAGSADVAVEPTRAQGAPEQSVQPESEAELTWRFWPTVAWQKSAVVASWVIFGVYWIGTSAMRFAPMFDPWSCDGDQPQAVWQYWRYHIDGAFPPGDLITDYAFVMHAPPVWWTMMATLSEIFTPITSAKILNVIAYLGAFALLYFVTASRSNHFVALASTTLMARGMDFYAQICGGYARSFGPLLVLLFLWMFLNRKHVGALLSLVFAAALYPSVVIPCGIAYGVYVVVAGPTMRDRLKRMAGMTAAGLAIIAFGKYQDILAPKWWGAVVSLDEARRMPAWGPGGRVAEYPLRALSVEMPKHAERGFNKAGHLLSTSLNTHFMNLGGYGPILVILAVIIGVLWWQRKKLKDAFPFELVMLAVAAVCAYFIARFFAFKFYLPYRALQHTLPYLFYISLPLALYCIFRNTLRTRIAASCAALGVAVVPAFILCGDGIQPNGNYWTNTHDAKLFMFLRSLPLDKQIAGQFYIIDRVPLFTYHRTYITKNLAHPFRAGYYAEAERRIRVVYNGLYATDLRDFVKSMDEEKIDYFMYAKSSFKETDRRLFQPVKRDMDKVFREAKKKGFVLEHLPPDVFAYSTGDDLVLDVHKLEEKLNNGEIEPTVPVPVIGPVEGPELEVPRLTLPPLGAKEPEEPTTEGGP